MFFPQFVPQKSYNDQLALSIALTAKTRQLCLGLESGAADILDLVTPTTAELLLWWFGEDRVLERQQQGLNFHLGQKQAILNAIVAHELLSQSSTHGTLLDLYRACAPDALLTGTRHNEIAQDKHAHPKYCFKMATGTGKTWVLQALLIWQLLNKTAALLEGRDDARFTRQFMIVAPGLIVYERLLDAFCGKLLEGGHGTARDFLTSDVVKVADLFIPEAYRELVFAFVRGNVCSKTEIGLKATGNGMIAITNWHLLNEGDSPAEDIENIETPGVPLEPPQIINAVLPLTPGRATGNSLDVLDRRYARGNVLVFLAALPELIENGNPSLSEGQRVMLRAGLQKLRKLETDFAKIDPTRHPKMLVVCEDTSVSPLVAAFFQDEAGWGADEVMLIDSGKKAELGEKEWAKVRQQLFSVDKRPTPRVIVSVLMLREGFDVNNICVIVPLRSSQAQILLEQTIGRGLRLMWRDDEYTSLKEENRQRINAGQEPGSLLDVLSIVEHPAFQSFYNELIQEGLAGATGDGMNDTSATGDVIAAELREGFEAFDFGIPFILQEADELHDHAVLNVSDLPAFTAMNLAQLTGLLGKGDTFISQDLQSATLFGDYRVDGMVMNVGGYNEYLSRLTRRISQALSEPLTKSHKVATHLAKPYLQINTAELTGWLDDYIWTQLFGTAFNPLEGENWRVLLLQSVLDHITKVFAVALLESEQKHITGQTEVHLRHLSEVPRLLVRESHSVEVSKSIYTRLAWPAHNGGLERSLIHWAQADTSVLVFCKLSENRHTFTHLRYVKDDGLPAFYAPTDRANLPWHYVLLAENLVHEWQSQGERLAKLLDYARLRPLAHAFAQTPLL